ncbi:MAG: hypothetical protein JWO68_1974, partial [Actinomycetia bacterium]|nr:hypothetical protein [Actinomycetes bacterium]
IPVKSATTNYPNVLKAMQMAVLAVNDAGGIKGRPLKLIHCDDRDSPTLAEICGRQLMNDEKVISIIGSPTRQMVAVWPTIESTKTPNFANIPILGQDFTSKYSFPLTGGIAGAGVMPKGVAEVNSIKTLAFVRSDTVSGSGQLAVSKPAYEKVGVKVVDIKINPAGGDAEQICFLIKRSGADHVQLTVAPVLGTALVKTCTRLGVAQDLDWLANGGATEPAMLQAFSAAKIPLTVSSNLGFDETRFPMRKELNAQFKKYGAKLGLLDGSSDSPAQSWLGVMLFSKIAAQLPSITKENFKAFLDKQSNLYTGMTKNLDFTRPVSPAYPRIFNGYYLRGKLKNGKIFDDAKLWVDGIN